MLVNDRLGDVYARKRPKSLAKWDVPDVARIYTKVRARVDTAALAATTQAFGISRILLLAVTYLAMAFHPAVWGQHHPSSATFWDAWYQWDARWFVRVARSGYHWHDLHQWSSVAFFPFYPLLILGMVTVIPVSTKLIAIIVSNLLFFCALYHLHRLVSREFGPRLAERALLYLSLFPTAMFFFAGYSESPFLLCSVLSFSSMRRRRWAWAGIWGCLAAATRSQGLVLMVPFAVECWAVCGPRWRDRARLLWLGLIPLGWAFLALFMQMRFADPLLFIKNQEAWHRTTTWPWVGLWETIRRIVPDRIAAANPAHNLIELLSVLLFAGLIAAGWRTLPRSFSLYAAAGLGMILVNPAVLDGYYLPLMSASRLCLALFPCFITLAMAGEHPFVDRLVTTLGPALLAIFTVIFLQGAWVA